MSRRARMLSGALPLLMRVACAGAGGPASLPPGPATQPPPAGTTFSLTVGPVLTLTDPAVQIGLAGIPQDSRCPRGERCVWAGDATVALWLQRPGEARRDVQLHTGPGLTRSVAIGSHTLRLLRLDPEPVSGRTIEQAAYVARFSLDDTRPGPATDTADR